jgi:hypothetical protein
MGHMDPPSRTDDALAALSRDPYFMCRCGHTRSTFQHAGNRTRLIPDQSEPVTDEVSAGWRERKPSKRQLVRPFHLAEQTTPAERSGQS